MPKRYAFFKNDHGEAHKRTDNEKFRYAPKALLAEIGKATVRTTEGAYGWGTAIMLQFEAALRASFLIECPDGSELNTHDAWGLFNDSFDEIAKRSPGEPISAEEVLHLTDKRAADFFLKDEGEYILVTSLNIRQLPVEEIAIAGCRIRSRLPSDSFPLPTVPRSVGEKYSKHLISTFYHRVKVHTKARTIFEAFQKTLHALDVLRGLWSLVANYRTSAVGLSGPLRKPLGTFHLGPIHVLYNADGTLVDGCNWFYDPDYTGDEIVSDKDWTEIEKDRIWAMEHLEALPFRVEAEKILARYAAALDLINLDTAFLHLWSILEKLTDTIGSNYDETIKRATWRYEKDHKLMKDVLHALRHCRNQMVHSAKVFERNDQVCSILKYILDSLIASMVRNEPKASNLKEFGEFYSQPRDVDALKKKAKNAETALEIRSHLLTPPE